jgi:hypothetical protein
MEPEDLLLCSQGLQVFILSQMNSIHTFPLYLPVIHRSIFSHLRLSLSRGLFPSGFLVKILYAFLIHPCYMSCLSILFDSITLKILGET